MPEEADVILRAQQAIDQTRQLTTEVDVLRKEARAAQEEARALRRSAALESRSDAIRAVRSRLAGLLAFVLVWTVLEAYIAINIHELYRDHCDSPMIAAMDDRPHWCDYIFVFDDNGRSTHNH